MSDQFISQHWIVLVHSAETSPAPYSLETISRLTGVHAERLKHYEKIGLLGNPRTFADSEPVFDDNALFEVRRIEHFRRHHGTNLRTISLLCSLSREVELLRAEVSFFRNG